MDRLRLSSSLASQIAWGLIGLYPLLAQTPLKKPNTFKLQAISRTAEGGLQISYEIPFDGVVEFRLLVRQDSVIFFSQWPSAQGKNQRKFPTFKTPPGSYRYRITYKGLDYTGEVRL